MSIVRTFNGTGNDFSWSDVIPIKLDDNGLINISKNILIGDNEKAPNFFMRYFRLKEKGHSRLEKHSQEHEVLILHGSGIIQIGDIKYQVAPFDVVYISPNELHQFSNPFSEPFGFICIIPNI